MLGEYLIKKLMIQRSSLMHIYVLKLHINKKDMQTMLCTKIMSFLPVKV